MNSLFGDATSVMPTPETLAEAESLFGSARSPVPSLDIRRQGGITADHAIPGLDIDPPLPEQDGAASSSRPAGPERSSSGRETSEGLGGWISNMMARTRGEQDTGGAYKRVVQDDDK